MDTDRYLMQLLTDYLWAVQSYMNSTNWFFFSADQNIFKLLCKLKFNYSSQEIDMDKNLQRDLWVFEIKTSQGLQILDNIDIYCT